MKLIPIPFGEWLPDLPALGNPGLITAKNVAPLTKSSYGPMKLPVAASTNALSGNPLGFIGAVYSDLGQVYDFAGDATKLYMATAPTNTWSDVSQPATTYNPAFGTGAWSMATFGARVIATNGWDEPQTFLTGTDTTFSDLSTGAAPHAGYCAAIRNFLVMAHFADAPYHVQWSAIGDPTYWPTPGTDAAIAVQSDEQDLTQADLGFIRGIRSAIGGNDGCIWCVHGVYRMNYEGSPAIFNFTPATGVPGTNSRHSIIRVPTLGGAMALYLAESGFYAFNGITATPIGDQKFARTFFDECHEEQLRNVMGAADPDRKLAIWAFGTQNTVLRFDRLLVYNYVLNRAAMCELTDPIYWLATRNSNEFSDNRKGFDELAAFDANKKLARFTGANMAPEIVTGDRMIFPGRRARIHGARPMVDGGVASVATACRDLPTGPVSYQVSVPVNVLGDCPQRASGRYARFRLTMPGASSFTHLQGIEVRATPGGVGR